MRKTILPTVIVGFIAIFALFLQGEAFSGEEETLTLKGVIIDNMCAKGSQDNLAEFIKTHTKTCALMEHCVASGFSIYVDGHLHKFDDASNTKIEEFLRKPSSKLKVIVTAKKSGEALSLISIKN